MNNLNGRRPSEIARVVRFVRNEHEDKLLPYLTRKNPRLLYDLKRNRSRKHLPFVEFLKSNRSFWFLFGFLE